MVPRKLIWQKFKKKIILKEKNASLKLYELFETCTKSNNEHEDLMRGVLTSFLFELCCSKCLN